MWYFCKAQFGTHKNLVFDDLPPLLAEALQNNMAEVFLNTVKLSIWISRRYYEVMIFRRLQNASNRLESFSTDELSKLAKALFSILTMGLSDSYQGSFLVSMQIHYVRTCSELQIRIRLKDPY